MEREVLERVIERDASIDLLIDDIREALRGKPYDVVSIAGGWAFRMRTAYADAIATSAAVPDSGVVLTQNEAGACLNRLSSAGDAGRRVLPDH